MSAAFLPYNQMRQQFQDQLNMFDPVNVSAAHQRALHLKKALSRRPYGGDTARTNPLAYQRALHLKKALSRRPYGGDTARTNPLAFLKRTVRSPKLRHELGHVALQFPKLRQQPQHPRGLFADTADFSLEGEPRFDEELEDVVDEVPEDQVTGGDIGQALVLRRICLTLKAKSDGDDWLRNNIFQSTCTIGGKVCKFVIDSGSFENAISEEVVQKLALKTEDHPNPYKLAWLKEDSDEDVISRRCLVSFSVGNYRDKAWCDVIEMDVCHLLLGRPWQYDRSVTYDGRRNRYSFIWNNVRFILTSTREVSLNAL